MNHPPNNPNDPYGNDPYAVCTAQNTSALQTEVESLRWDISQEK